jgi:hypothetical protein
MAWRQFPRPKTDTRLACKVETCTYKSLLHTLQRGYYCEEEGAHVQYCTTWSIMILELQVKWLYRQLCGKKQSTMSKDHQLSAPSLMACWRSLYYGRLYLRKWVRDPMGRTLVYTADVVIVACTSIQGGNRRTIRKPSFLQPQNKFPPRNTVGVSSSCTEYQQD